MEKERFWEVLSPRSGGDFITTLSWRRRRLLAWEMVSSVYEEFENVDWIGAKGDVPCWRRLARRLLFSVKSSYTFRSLILLCS